MWVVVISMLTNMSDSTRARRWVMKTRARGIQLLRAQGTTSLSVRRRSRRRQRAKMTWTKRVRGEACRLGYDDNVVAVEESGGEDEARERSWRNRAA